MRLVRLLRNSECAIDVLAETCDSEFGPKLRTFFVGLEIEVGCPIGQFNSDISRSFAYGIKNSIPPAVA